MYTYGARHTHTVAYRESQNLYLPTDILVLPGESLDFVSLLGNQIVEIVNLTMATAQVLRK